MSASGRTLEQLGSLYPKTKSEFLWISSSPLPGSGNPGQLDWFVYGSLEKEMATHSSFLAWKIPWTEKPGKLQSTGSKRVGHD